MRQHIPTDILTHIGPFSTLTIIHALGLLGFAVIIALAPLIWIPIAIGVVAGGLVLLRHPWFIWIILGIALPWTSGIRLGVASVTDLFLVVALTLWFVDAVRRERVTFSISGVAIAAFGYCIALYLSAFNAVDIGDAALEIVKWLQFTVVLLVLPTMIDADHHVPWLVSALFAGAVSQAFLGIYQFYFMVGPEWFIIQGQYMRASGSFSQPNPFGGYMGITLPVAVSILNWFSVRPLRKRRVHWHDITGWSIARTVVPIIGTGLLVSWSRGAWLGAVAAVLVVMWVSSTRLVRIIALIVVTTILLIGAAAPLMRMVPPDILARFSDIPAQFGLGASIDAEITDENFAILERLAFWLAALRMWDYAPWFGVGPGNFDAVYSTFAVPRWEMSLGHAHNIYLNTLAETGIFGMAVFLWLWGSVVVLAYRSYLASRRSNRWRAALSVGILGVVTHLAIHSLFDNLFVQGMFLHLSLWIAILLTLQSASNEPPQMAKVN
ncbi:MAG: O-antigen ligase family protein [Litorilinea sp.]